MPSIELCALLSILALIAFKVISLLAQQHRLKRLMPPGPAGLPLLGNIFQLSQLPWLRFTEWKEQYGPIFTLNLAGQSLVIVNDFTTAGDLLDRRSTIYSDRPRFIVAGEILAGGMVLAFLKYGDLWRRMRKAAHEGLNIRASTTYRPLQEKESLLLASHLLNDPDNWCEHLNRSAASTILGAVYAWPPIGERSDSVVERITAFMHRLATASMPGAYLVEIFPIMLYLPDWMASWKRKAKKQFKIDSHMFEGFMDDVSTKKRLGSLTPCFASTLLDAGSKFNLSSREAAWLAAILFGAGSETTATAMTNFFLAMTLYPNVMRQAQAHIDSIVGRGRLPNFADREKLPYIDAMVKEVLRWRPVGPLGVPRCATTDDWYKGYFIPKGTLVVYNVWAMNHDPTYFPDFDEFRPDRFLDTSGRLSISIPDTHGLGHYTFGSGRRDLAIQSLFIDIAVLLWAFDIGKVVDNNGQPITPSRTDCVDAGLVVRPASFKCTISPRTEEVIAIIRAAAVE